MLHIYTLYEYCVHGVLQTSALVLASNTAAVTRFQMASASEAVLQIYREDDGHFCKKVRWPNESFLTLT